MRKIYIILLFNSLFVYPLISQTLIQRIEYAYNSLDSMSYLEKVRLSFKKDMEKREKETDNLMWELRGTDSTRRQNANDSIYEKTKNYYSSLPLNLKECDELFITNNSAYYVLNLRMDSCGRSNKHICLVPDMSNLPFSLFFFDKRSNMEFFVLVNDGEISHYDSSYRTFSKLTGKNAPKVFKTILRKNPKYLLYCYDLEQMNTILYVLNSKIYVCRIAQLEEYELSDYIEKFIL